MLLVLARTSRSVDLPRLSLSGFRMTSEGEGFLPIALAKQSNLGRAIKEFFFVKFVEKAKLYPAAKGLVDHLFIAIIKLHLPVTLSTIVR